VSGDTRDHGEIQVEIRGIGLHRTWHCLRDAVIAATRDP